MVESSSEKMTDKIQKQTHLRKICSQVSRVISSLRAIRDGGEERGREGEGGGRGERE